MQHIQREFHGSIQYICVASLNESHTLSPVMYIQIILLKPVNKETYFLRTIAGSDSLALIRTVPTDFLTGCMSLLFASGDECNYQVTCDDRAWNAFLKNSELHIF